MKFIRQSRKNLQFKVPEEILHESPNVKIYDGTAFFNILKFQDAEACENWYEENIEGGTMKINPEANLTKGLHGIKAVSSEPTEKEWKIIQSLMTTPEEFTKEDIAVYHPLLAHNMIDRDNQRFDKEMLTGFSKTIVDKPLLIGHEGSGSFRGPGVGRFFAASLEKKSFDEALELLGPQIDQKRTQKTSKAIEEEDGGLYFLRTSFYILKDNYELIRQIGAGIVKDMSIQFRAESKEAVQDKDGKLDYWVWRGKGEALEGSFVWLGAQPGAQNKKDTSNKENLVPVPTVPEKSESVKAEETKQKEVKRMKLELKSLGLTLESDDEADISKQIETKASALVSQVETLGEEITTLKAEKQVSVDTIKALEAEVGEGNLTPEHLKEVEGNAKAYKDFLVGECIRIGNFAKAFRPEDLEAKREEFDALDIPALKSKIGEYQTICDNSGTPTGQLKSEPESKYKDPKARHIPETHFNLFN